MTKNDSTALNEGNAFAALRLNERKDANCMLPVLRAHAFLLKGGAQAIGATARSERIAFALSDLCLFLYYKQTEDLPK